MQRLLIVALFVFGFAGPLMAQGGSLVKDEKLGYQVRAPKDWTPIPIANEERWIVAKYLSDRDSMDQDETGWTVTFKPEMRIIVFPQAVTGDRGVTRTEEETGDGSNIWVEVKNPYRDYKDYLDRNYSGGGWFVFLEEEQKRKDLSFTLIEIKVEKLARSGKKRLVAGVFHASDADFVVQLEVLEKDYPKSRNMLYGVLRSFEFIPRKGSLAPATSGRRVIRDEDEMTPKERAEYREEQQRIAFRKATEALPPGWQSFEYKGVLVLSHVDRKFAMKIVGQILALQAWLDKEFDYLGDEYVRPPIVRICKDYDEERSFGDTSGDAWSFDGGSEILTHEDKGSGSLSWEFEWINRSVLSRWLRDRDPQLAFALPSWFRIGLSGYVRTGSLKGRRMEFGFDDAGLKPFRVALANGGLTPLDVFLASDSVWEQDHGRGQAAYFMRFCLEGGKKGKDFLETYILGLRDYVREKEKQDEEELEKALEGEGPREERPKTEEEEAEEFRKRQQAWEGRRQEVLTEVLSRAFADWTKDDWAKLDRAFQAWAR